MSAAEWELVQRQSQAAEARHTENGARRTPLDLIGLKRPLPAGFDINEYRLDRVIEPTRLWKDGDVIDLGAFKLEVVLIPAHTTGSIALLERERRLLFTGDTAHRGTIWLHLDGSAAPDVTFATYERLADYADLVDYVLPAHNTLILPGSFLTDLNEKAKQVRAGRIEPRTMETFAGNGWFYDFGGYGMLFREKIGPDMHAPG